MTKLLSSQISGQNGRVRFCMRCLNSFGRVEARSEHIEICQGHEPVTVLKPDDENVKLKNMNHKMPVLFVCYADFEFSTEGIETWEKKPEKSFTNEYEKHGPSGHRLFFASERAKKKFNMKPIVRHKRTEG